MRPRSPVLVGLAVAGLAALGGAVALVLTSDHEPHKALLAVAGGITSAGFIGTGLFAWWRRPYNHTGLLMYAVGVAFLLGALQEANPPVLFDLGLLIQTLYIALLVHLVVAFPSGQLSGRADRRLVFAIYAAIAVLSVLPVLFRPTKPPQPRDVFMLVDSHPVVVAGNAVGGLVGVVSLAGIVVLLVRRWRGATRPQRRIIAPVLWTGAILAAALALSVLLGAAGAPRIVSGFFGAVATIAVAAVPFAFLAGLLRSRLTRADIVGELVERLQAPGSDSREAIARALGDPSLELVYWRTHSGAYVSADGQPAQLPEPGRARAVAEIDSDRRPIAAMIFDASLSEEPELVSAVSSAAGLALDNSRLQAELRARIAELEESRARVLDAELGERRRLERDLHDGAQQRFVSLSLTLALLDRGITDPAQRELLDSGREQLDLGLTELRELARGIHPAVLTERGLAPAIDALAARAPLDVRVLEVPAERLPAQVEAAAYFIVSESLTNAAKHAHAAAATVRIGRANGSAVVEVTDDGVGGADPARGSGLRGMVDRLAALDGGLAVDSPAGGGTHIQARIPCA
jgi:signal transduction histidine kinase